MASVLVPFLYVVIVFGGLYIFSYLYRKHNANKTVEPYFDSHPERNTYITLLQKTDPPAPESLLKAALIRRAVADVHRVMRIREDKPALQNLLQKGSIGEDLWNSLVAAEKELEAEILDVVSEANSFVEGWGQLIFPTAHEVIANEKMRLAYDRTAEMRAEYERKYRRKSKATGTPGHTSTSSPPQPTSQQLPPQLPLSAQSTADGLLPPPSAGAESASSDGETHPSPSQPDAPRSKSANKKHKKRK